MSLLEQFGSPALMRALGWTLLHSLWQGALVALAAAALLMLLHRHAAALRYRVAAAALLTLLVLSGITLGYYYSTFRAAPAAEALNSASPSADQLPGVAATEDLSATAAAIAPASEETAAPAPGRLRHLLLTGQLYLERNMPVVVVAWLLGMLAMTLRFLSGLAYVQRLRRYRVAALPAEWQTRLDALVARTGLRQPVRILASGLVPGPLVVGWLKPVILLPMSAASGMSGTELEAILAHELAHVLRRDYLFNLLQSVAEILFFYHPAVWFLSNCLRTERENCCDDMATELCGDSLVLAQALASLATLQHAPAPSSFTPQLAMAAAGQPGSLLGRVRRLVQHRATAPTFSDGFWAACVVLLSVGVLTASTVLSLSAASFSTAVVNKGAEALQEQFADSQDEVEADNQDQVVEAQAEAQDPGSPDENPEGKDLTVNYRGKELLPGSDDTVVVYGQTNPKLLTKSGRARLNEIKGLTVVVKNEEGAISEVYVDGKKVPASELPAYQQALNKTQQADRGNSLADRRQATRERMAQLSQRMSSAALAGRTPTDADAEELSRLAMAEAGEAMRNQSWPNQTEINQRFISAERTLNEQLQNGRLNEEQREEIRSELQKVQQERRRVLEQTSRDREQGVRDAAQAREDAAQARRDALQARRDQDQARRDEEQARRDQDQARRDEEQARRDAQDEIWRQALISELKRDGLIQNPDTYSFSLSATSLTVNGKKQPDALQQKYRKLYEDRTGRKISATGSINIQQQSNVSASRYNMPAPPRPPRPAAAPAAPSVPSVAAVPAPPMPPRLDSDQIREALRKDGLIEKDAKSFMFQLNSKGLMVNGEQQPAAMADKYRKLLGNGQSGNTNINISVSE